MSGSGVRTCMDIIHQTALPIRTSLTVACPGCFAAGAGVASPGAAVRRFVSTIRQAAGATTWASASPGYVRFWFFTFLPFGTATA